MERDFKKFRYLIVDDSLQTRRIIASSLKTIGCENFIEAGDCAEALSKLATDDSIEFLITGWNMYGLPPREMVKTIRANGQTEKLPILLVDEKEYTIETLSALNIGVNNFIAKPFTAINLQRKIIEILADI